MKIFIVKLVSFAALLGLAWAGLGVLMYRAEKEAYYKGLSLGPRDEYIAICDSRTEHMLNPEYIPGLKNISIGGSQMCVWKVRMDDIMSVNRDSRGKVFVIEVAPMQLCMSRGHYLRDCDYAKAFFWLLHPELDDDIHFPFIFRNFTQNEFPQQFLVWLVSLSGRRPFKCGMDGTFTAPAEKGGYSMEELKVNAANDAKSMSDFKFSEEDMLRLDGFVQSAKAHGWKLLFVTFPMPGQGMDQPMMKKFTADVSKYCASNGVSYINMADVCQGLDNWVDIGHPNQKGGAIISKAFVERASSL